MMHIARTWGSSAVLSQLGKGPFEWSRQCLAQESQLAVTPITYYFNLMVKVLACSEGVQDVR